MVSIALSERWEIMEWRVAYTLLELLKSARERYIRVAAIDIVISPGIVNIWFVSDA